MMERNDFDNLFSDDVFFFDFEGSVLSDLTLPENLNDHPSPDSMSSWIDQIESMLMNDEDQSQHINSDQLPPNDFLAEIRVNSPAESPTCIQVVDTFVNAFNDSGFGSSEKRSSDRCDDKEAVAADDDGSDDGSDDSKKENIIMESAVEFHNIGELPDDSVPSKRRSWEMDYGCNQKLVSSSLSSALWPLWT